MAQVLSDKDCFICQKAGYNVKVDLEKIGQKPDGKAIWKSYEAGTFTEHQHKGSAQQKVNQAEEFKNINTKLDQIINFLKGQGSLDVQSNE
jgi:hypothetical protein